MDTNILDKFISSKNYKGIISDAVKVNTNSFISIFVENVPYYVSRPGPPNIMS